MKISVTEISDNVFRICLFPDGGFIGFNHFLIRDQAPALIHTGHRRNFPVLYREVAKILNPQDISYFCFSHMEPDECGSLNDWLAACPKSEIAVGKIGAMSMRDFADGPCRELKDNDALDLGDMKLRILLTPHFPHQWDGCLFYEETRGILFCSDVASQQGERPDIVHGDISEMVMDFQGRLGFIPYGIESLAALTRLRNLRIDCLAVMHGSAVMGHKQTGAVLGNLRTHIEDRIRQAVQMP